MTGSAVHLKVFIKSILLIACLWLFPPSVTFADDNFAIDHIVVVTDIGRHDFTVEIADTYAKRKQGLMGRKSLAPDHGMLFVFGREKPLSFWMKNTPLSLDLIFFDHQGRYVSHHSHAVPHSEDSIRSGQPAQFVLEINAGLADQLGISKGSVFTRKLTNH